ncbi:MAG: SemiSWEET transporter [Chitinophagaceae bacterium]|nr:SemiSWEET transporter [Chitinophagaceae bacterium]
MSSNDTLGLIAGALTSISFLPQVIKTWRTKSAKDLSLVMFGIFSAGATLWLIYGLQVNSLPIISANLLTLFL